MKRNNFLKAIVALPFVSTLLSLTNRPKSVEKTYFTPEMLKRHNYGLFIINSKVKEVTLENVGYAATVSWKLGYCMNLKGSGHYGMINFLTDGWFCPIGNNYEEVCQYLNNNPYEESFRLMTEEEVLFIISNRKQGFL